MRQLKFIEEDMKTWPYWLKRALDEESLTQSGDSHKETTHER